MRHFNALSGSTHTQARWTNKLRVELMGDRGTVESTMGYRFQSIHFLPPEWRPYWKAVTYMASRKRVSLKSINRLHLSQCIGQLNNTAFYWYFLLPALLPISLTPSPWDWTLVSGMAPEGITHRSIGNKDSFADGTQGGDMSWNIVAL